MNYTILELSKMAGVTTRTLRFYDQKGLLCPRRQNSSGYRLYDADDVTKLQQILFYKELGVQLLEIKRIVNDKNFDYVKALADHRQKLVQRRNQLNRLIDNVDKTLSAFEGSIKISDSEMFDGFKREIAEENERKYGTEIREKYGEKIAGSSKNKILDLKEEEYETMQRLAAEVLVTLKTAMDEGDPAGETAQKCAELHRQWLTFSWPSYSGEAHAGLAQMYVSDPRFRAYYDDAIGSGAAEFLRDAVFVYTKKK